MKTSGRKEWRNQNCDSYFFQFYNILNSSLKIMKKRTKLTHVYLKIQPKNVAKSSSNKPHKLICSDQWSPTWCTWYVLKTELASYILKYHSVPKRFVPGLDCYVFRKVAKKKITAKLVKS